MTDEEKLQQNAELQRKMEDARAKNMRMREEIAVIREEHNYWRALYHTVAVNIFTQLASTCSYRCEFDVKQTAEKARIRAKELIRQLREEESSQRL